MKGLWLEDGALRFRTDLPEPQPGEGEALIRIERAGVCGTDVALRAGMYGFTGVPGHEFVGHVETGPEEWVGARVVGEINLPCGECPACTTGETKHCARRAALGIRSRHGAFAERLALPVANLHRVPDAIASDAATFTEPLAAALDTLNHADIDRTTDALVLGAGRLGQLVCIALAGRCASLTLASRDASKRERAVGHTDRRVGISEVPERAFGVVVECTGSAAGLAAAQRAIRPRGTIVLKGTGAGALPIDATALVVDEVRLAGSRCGDFEAALERLESVQPQVLALIDGREPLARAAEAIDASSRPGVIKVIVDVG